ncbi:MAG: carbohydrate kinase family protein [Bacteroidota bacterium]
MVGSTSQLYADLLKINHQELAKISGWMGQFESDQQRAEMLIQRFDIQGVIITRGANGALFIPAEGNPTAHRGYKITVADTIGAGDSFLAAFLSRWVQKASIAECLDFACGLGALVASHKGANPSLSVADIEAFIQAQKG